MYDKVALFVMFWRNVPKGKSRQYSDLFPTLATDVTVEMYLENVIAFNRYHQYIPIKGDREELTCEADLDKAVSGQSDTSRKSETRCNIAMVSPRVSLDVRPGWECQYKHGGVKVKTSVKPRTMRLLEIRAQLQTAWLLNFEVVKCRK